MAIQLIKVWVVLGGEDNAGQWEDPEDWRTGVLQAKSEKKALKIDTFACIIALTTNVMLLFILFSSLFLAFFLCCAVLLTLLLYVLSGKHPRPQIPPQPSYL